MSETTGGNNFKPPIPTTVDPSAGSLHATMMSAYADVNEYIARDRAIYGATLQASHLSASQAAITETSLEALRRAGPSDEHTAIILGAGGCGDIPLEQLLTDFDKTTIVDIHTEQTEQALSKLPLRILRKASLVKAELSGLAKGVAGVFEEASTERNYSQFLDAATALARKLDVVKSQVEFGSDYAFVCSQLLMTQLSSIPLTHFSRLVGEKYGRPLTMVPGHEDEALITALNEKNVKVQAGHIDHLSHLSRSNGTVHFADTLGEVRGGQKLRMVPPDVLQAIENNFDHVREPDFWYYRPSLSQTFVVGSYSLTPKPQA